MTRSWRSYYYNTNLKVEPLANKVTRTKENQKCGINNIIDGLTVMMSNAHGRAYMRMNNGQFETLYIGHGGRTIQVYNNVGTTDEPA